MSPPDTTIFVTPQDAESAFYAALEMGDLQAMMRVWSDDEEIVCIHPGGPVLIGYDAVREAWQRIFSHSGRLSLWVAQKVAFVTPFAVITHVLEHFSQAGDERMSAPVAATNIYTRGAVGWRMVGHHASPAPPDSQHDMPKVLH